MTENLNPYADLVGKKPEVEAADGKEYEGGDNDDDEQQSDEEEWVQHKDEDDEDGQEE